MSLSSEAFPPPGGVSWIKHLFLWPEAHAAGQEYSPKYYVEAKIDFADVRSGYHMTCGVSDILEMVALEGDLLWTRDMVRPVDPEALKTSMPEGARLQAVPSFVTEDILSQLETRYLSYLLRHTEARVYRNFALNTYSHPGETLGDFQSRCLEMYNDSFRRDLDGLREVVNRRLELAEQSCTARERSGEFRSERRLGEARSRLHAVAERIAELFVNMALTFEDPSAALEFPDPARTDLEHRLQALEIDVRHEIRRLLISYQEKVRNIDEYIIHPSLKDLHLVRACLLWVPVEAAGR